MKPNKQHPEIWSQINIEIGTFPDFLDVDPNNPMTSQRPLAAYLSQPLIIDAWATIIDDSQSGSREHVKNQQPIVGLEPATDRLLNPVRYRRATRADKFEEVITGRSDHVIYVCIQ